MNIDGRTVSACFFFFFFFFFYFCLVFWVIIVEWKNQGLLCSNVISITMLSMLSVMQSLSLLNKLINKSCGVMCITCRLLRCSSQLFGLWWHPFAVKDPLVSKWCSRINWIHLFYKVLPLTFYPHLGWLKGEYISGWSVPLTEMIFNLNF